MTKRTATYILALLLLFFTGSYRAQDTVSVFFDFGKSKLKRSQFASLNHLVNRFDLSSLDSVHFIGMSDSVGNVASNLKLSRQRALHIQDFCSAIFNPSIPSKVYAQGEKNAIDPQRNRRVDVVLFFAPQEPESLETEVIGQDKKGCFYIDYQTIYGCHIYTIVKQKKKFSVLELFYYGNENTPQIKEMFLKRISSLYYGSLDKNKKFQVKKVRWKEKTTGRSWWKGKRYQAIIPKLDFDQFNIFHIKALPCTDCQFAERFDSIPYIQQSKVCLYPDPIVMSHMQYKTLAFKRQKIQIRVPREFVDSSLAYFVNGLKITHPVLWETKRSKRKQEYVYSEIYRNGSYLPAIFREFSCVPDTNCKPFNRFPSKINCAGFTGRDFNLRAETGVHRQSERNVAYLALGLNFTTLRNGEFEALAGIHSNSNLYASARTRFSIYQFRTKKLAPENGWQHINHFMQEYRIKWKFNFYAGMEMKGSLGQANYRYLEHNVHLGLSVNHIYGHYKQRLFLQAGGGYDLLAPDRPNLYPIVQVGYAFVFW